MLQERSVVLLLKDFDQIAQEMVPQPMWMIRPACSRKYAWQRIMITAEIVDLTTLNLATMSTFEVL
jgi:hypothetical protein